MRKRRFLGRRVVAVLLCAVLMMNFTPHVFAYAAYLPNGAPSNLPEDFNGYVSEDYIESREYVDTGLREGLVSTSKDSIYSSDGSYYSKDITSQLEAPKQEPASVWQQALDSLISVIKHEGQGALASLISAFIYSLAVAMEALLNDAGIALDNIIFGRVGGNGVKVAANTYVSFFHFELEKGNPYGVVAAMVYSLLRKYMYIIMILVAFFSLIKVARNNDIPRAKLDFKEKMLSLFQVFGLVVFMPYFLEVGLYIRDIILHGVLLGNDGILGVFTGTDVGLISAFRENCGDVLINEPELMASVLYFAATCVAIVYAFLYIGNALRMLIHTISFPIVCVKSLFDNKALGTWTWEMVSLAAVPIFDGLLLMVPVIFNKAANGTLGLNFVSLITCCCMMTARQQFRRSVGLQTNNAMEVGGFMTAMGMARLIGSIGHAGKRAIGQAAGGLKQGASDDAMANYYEAQAAKDRFNTRDAEAQIDNGYFNSHGGVGENPAAKTGMGTDMGLCGSLAYKMQKAAEAKSKEPESVTSDVYVRDAEYDKQATAREQDLRDAQITAVLGKQAPVQGNSVAEEFATIDNFESQEFANKLSNAKKAELYRQRAHNARVQGITSSVATVGGAVVGGTVGFAGTAYMDSGTSAMITSAGIDLGSSAGSAISGAVSIGRQVQDANKKRTITGEGSELKYEINVDKEGAGLHTSPRFGEVYPASLESNNLPATNDTQGDMSATPNREAQQSINIQQIGGPMKDATTGEYYYAADGSPITVEVPNMNNQERFVSWMNANEDFKESYLNNVQDAVRETWNDEVTYFNGDTNYKTAAALSAQAKMNINITPEEKYKVNCDIENYKNATLGEVSVSVGGPVMKKFNDQIGETGKEISKQDYAAIVSQTQDFAKTKAEEYIAYQNWDFDALMLK